MQMICTCIFNTSGYNVYKQGQSYMYSYLSRYDWVYILVRKCY